MNKEEGIKWIIVYIVAEKTQNEPNDLLRFEAKLPYDLLQRLEIAQAYPAKKIPRLLRQPGARKENEVKGQRI